jgi:hypothetical protein
MWKIKQTNSMTKQKGVNKMNIKDMFKEVEKINKNKDESRTNISRASENIDKASNVIKNLGDKK